MTASSTTAPVVLVTGALAGIGRATALAFAREGARLVVSGRNQEAGDALAAELRALGAEALFLRADVRNEAEVRSLVDQTVERFGRLDAAVNNAGTEGQPGPVVDQTAETYAATFDTNVLGVLLSMKHELRVMQAQGSGSIVNVSSAYGKIGAAGASVYVASKHAVEGPDEVGRAGSRDHRHPRQRGRAGPDRDRHARPLHRRRRRQGLDGRPGAGQAPRATSTRSPRRSCSWRSARRRS